MTKSADMDIAASLRAACAEVGWSPLQLAAKVNKKSSETARAWLDGRRIPPGDVIVFLMRSEPAFRHHLLRRQT